MESLPENSTTQKQEVQHLQPEKTESNNFRRFLEISRAIVVKKPKVEGADNLTDLGSSRAIFATSHLSDADPVIAASVLLSLGRNFDIASLQTNQQAFAPILKIVGKDRFHDIANTFDAKKNLPHTNFDSQDYVEMAEVVRKGKDIVIAAHKPSRNWQLPERAGVGDVYLAHLTETPIIPVSVDIHSKEAAGMADAWVKTIRRALTRKRPEVTIRIGKPISFEKMQDQELADVGMILTGKRDELRNTDERYKNALANYQKLREQSETVLKAIADLLPPEKRNKITNPLSQQQTQQTYS